jgi:hypothetical protein
MTLTAETGPDPTARSILRKLLTAGAKVVPGAGRGPLLCVCARDSDVVLSEPELRLLESLDAETQSPTATAEG